MKKLVILALLMIAALCYASQAVADMYQWVDANGVTHFSDVPPPTRQKTKTIKTTDFPSQAMEEAQGMEKEEPVVDSEPIAQEPVEKKVTKKSKKKNMKTNTVAIYTTDW